MFVKAMSGFLASFTADTKMRIKCRKWRTKSLGRGALAGANGSTGRIWQYLLPAGS